MFHFATFKPRTVVVTTQTLKCTSCVTGCGEYAYIIELKALDEVIPSLDTEAIEAASERTRSRLAWWAQRSIEPVPCPVCGRFQPDMVALLNNKRYEWMFITALFMLVLGGMGIFIGGIETTEAVEKQNLIDLEIMLLLSGGAVFTVAGGLFFWLSRRWLRINDPNERIPKEIRMAIASEKAMIIDQGQNFCRDAEPEEASL